MKMVMLKNTVLKDITAASVILLAVLLIPAFSFAADAMLSWNAPSYNDDGTLITDLEGYNVYYGIETGIYTKTIDVGNVTTYQLGGLTEGLTYFFVVTAYDTSGNESGYSNEESKAIQSSDTIPPTISGIYADNITSSSATINWHTDEDSDTQVEYGTTSSYGSSTSIDASPVTSHRQTLSGLLPSTQYHYRVLSRDPSDNLSVSGDYTFTTAEESDTSPPSVSNIQVTGIENTSATIAWTTDEPSTSQVEFGLTSAYGNLTTLDSNLVTVHSVEVTGLDSYTPYEYRVRSQDASGNEAISENFSFTTSNTPPAITSFDGEPLSGESPLTVDFSVSAYDPDGYIVEYAWDFDWDGNYDDNTSQNTFYTYTDAGTYIASVRVTDDGGASAEETITITVLSKSNEPPSISSFTASPDKGEAPLEVTFSIDVSDPDGEIIGYEWDFDGDGTFEATTDTVPASHLYSINGIYTARVRAADDGGATVSGETTITVTGESQNSGGSDDSGGGGEGEEQQQQVGCFIATAAYGSHLDPHVTALRTFRDKFLLTNPAGRSLVAFYYRTSPPVAAFISKHKPLRVMTRSILTPVVYGIKYPLWALFTSAVFCALWYIIRKKAILSSIRQKNKVNI
jgi:PKD repeat protein